ncbi:hypothetical protein [Chryseobacterium sp. M5A1_1a]
MKTENRLIKFICFFGVLFLLQNCTEKQGQDKYPDIPEFPATTNDKIVIQQVFKDLHEILYNDSVLVCKHTGDSISFYSIKSETSKVIKSNVFVYGSNFFIVENKKGEYEALNDITLEKEDIKTVDESGKYQRIADSLGKIFTKKSEYEVSQLTDSLFINYFCSKYHLPKDKIPFTSSLRKNDFYVKTEQDEFLLLNTPYSLEKFISPTFYPTSKQMKLKFKRNFRFLKDNLHSESFFKEYDYALKSKSWVSMGGGNHYIPSIPFMAEAGYYYLNVSFNNEKGKCKVVADRSPDFKTIPIKAKNKSYFVDNGQINKITIK